MNISRASYNRHDYARCARVCDECGQRTATAQVSSVIRGMVDGIAALVHRRSMHNKCCHSVRIAFLFDVNQRNVMRMSARKISAALRGLTFSAASRGSIFSAASRGSIPAQRHQHSAVPR